MNTNYQAKKKKDTVHKPSVAVKRTLRLSNSDVQNTPKLSSDGGYIWLG